MKKAGLVVGLVVVCVIGYFIYLSDTSSESEPVPVITVMDILHATDLQDGIKQAVVENNSDALNSWMEKAVHVGEQAGLAADDMAYLNSQRAIDYVKFNAKRSLFNDEFEKRYYALEDIDSLKAAYPEAKDLFVKVNALIEKRDQIISQIAETLSQGQTPGEAQISEARRLWQERYRERAENAGQSAQ